MKRVRKVLKRLIPTLMASALLLGEVLNTSNLISVYADSVDDTGENTSGSGSGGYSGGGTDSSWFETIQSGYRFYIVDENFNLMSSILDITYATPATSTEHMYWSTATQVLNQSNAHRLMTWEDINSLVSSVSDHIPVGPLVKGESSDKVYVEKGEEFKQWVINGIGGGSISYAMSEMNKDTSNTNSNKTTSSIGSSGSSSGSSGSSGSSSAKVAEISSMTYKEVESYINDMVSTYGTASLLNLTAKSEMIAAANKIASINGTKIEVGEQILTEYLTSNANKIANGGISGTQVRNAIYYGLMSKGVSSNIALALAIYIYPSSVAITHGTSVASNNDIKETEVLTEDIDTEEDYFTNSLEQTIATGNAEGYLIDILNYKGVDGSRLLYYTYDGANNDQLITKTMASKGWFLIVEPVFWTHYTTVSNGKDDFYTYGSYRDLVNYYSQKGYTGCKANNKQLMNRYGWRSMTIGTTVSFGSITFSPPSFTQVDDCAYISELAANASTMGYAMHIYSAEGSAYTKTRSEDAPPGVEHQAPIPSDTSTYDEKITIVKVYQISNLSHLSRMFSNTNKASISYRSRKSHCAIPNI